MAEAIRCRRIYEAPADDDGLRVLVELAVGQDITLVYAAREEPGNSARVLHSYLRITPARTISV